MLPGGVGELGESSCIGGVGAGGSRAEWRCLCGDDLEEFGGTLVSRIVFEDASKGCR
jgi:hypothetical protein